MNMRILGEPYGGALVDQVLPSEEADQKLRETKDMTGIQPFIDFIYDSEKIANGAYSPLDGFVDSTTFESIVKNNRLPNGLPWTIPIVITIPNEDEKAKEIKEGEEIALLD